MKAVHTHISSSAGFTLLEILIAVAILVAIGSIALVSFRASRNIRDVTTGGQNVLSVLRLAQSKTLAGEDDSTWGVRLQSSQVTLFEGNTFATATFTQAYPLPATIQLTSIALAGGGVDVIFNRVTGQTDQMGTFLLSVTADPTNTFPITVDSSGQVYKTASFSAVAVARLVDARHRSFTLGWSIKTATTLTFTFADPSVVQNVTMSTFFDAAKTKFDWPGTVTVGGLDQVLRIHTTTLTDTDTVLSVDRDCRKNTKQLTITIDGKAIATYESDCTNISVGSFGGVISEP